MDLINPNSALREDISKCWLAKVARFDYFLSFGFICFMFQIIKFRRFASPVPLRLLSSSSKRVAVRLPSLVIANRTGHMAEFSSTSTPPVVKTEAETPVITAKLADIVANAHDVRKRIDDHCATIGRDPHSVTLIPVSKTKPAEDIQALYDAGYRHFGENYFQELVDKAALLPKDIQWHFIGHLQSSKSAPLIRLVHNLAVVETVDSIKLASKLNNGCVISDRASLDIYVQVDTSGEDSKSGIVPGELGGLIAQILTDCPRLCIRGLMTIGAPGDMTCFDRLAECAVDAHALISAAAAADGAGAGGAGAHVPVQPLLLSMGMSADYEEAITRGSTSVRVGSTIFGERNYAK
jgi:pyridoxal phosphate enzyme (YggS family)